VNSGGSFSSQILARLDSPLCVVDQRGVVRAANASFAVIAGQSPVALQGMALGALLPDKDAGTLLAQLAQPALAHPTIVSKIGIGQASRRVVSLNVIGEVAPDSDEILIGASSIADELAEQMHDALLELTAILDNAAAGIAFTRDRIIKGCNQRFTEIFGYGSPQELIGKPAILLYPDADTYERVSREATPLLASGRAFHTAWLGRKADGSAVWCNVYGKAVDPAHTERGTVWILEDVTRAKRTEEALRQTRGMMGATMENAPVGIVLSHDRRMTSYNPKFREMFGFDGDSGVGLPGRTIYRSDEEYDALGRAAGPLLSKGEPFATEMFMRRQDGSDLWVSLIGYVQDPQDPRGGTIWIIEDHSERKRAEESLKQTREELAAIMRNAPVGIVFTRDRRIFRYNPKLAQMFGFEGEQAVGLLARVLYRTEEEYLALAQVAAPLLSRGEPFQTELFLRRQDGTDVWVNLIGCVQNLDNPGEATIWIAEDRSAFK